MEQLQRKYGFWTATAMVVGIVIGSGVFFKADDVLFASAGRLPVAILAWLIGGAIMVVTAYTFSLIATRIERVNGLVDYFEEAYGEKAAYHVAWFMTFVYYPTLVAVLSWVSANYTVGLLDLERGLWLIAFFYLILFFLLNVYSPVLAGRWQISATVIKLIPLVLVALFGTVAGLFTGQTVESFAESAGNIAAGGGGLAVATLATAFAYEGWIIATTINAELRDSRRTLPRALVVGTIVVVLVYLFYYLGISGVLSNSEVLEAGDQAPVEVMSLIFGRLGGSLLTVFVIVSCLGTLNGLIMGSARGMYSIASRDLGPGSAYFKVVHAGTNATRRSALLGFVFSVFWLIVWYGNFAGWWGGFMDISELPIAILYVIYISIYVWMIRKLEYLHPFGRYVAPALAGLGSLYIIFGAVQKAMFLHFFVLAILFALAGYVLMNAKARERSPE